MGALFLDRGCGGQWFLQLDLLSAAVGTVAMVAATQAWEVAMVTFVCIIVVAVTVWWLRAYARRRETTSV